MEAAASGRLSSYRIPHHGLRHHLYWVLGGWSPWAILWPGLFLGLAASLALRHAPAELPLLFWRLPNLFRADGLSADAREQQKKDRALIRELTKERDAIARVRDDALRERDETKADLDTLQGRVLELEREAKASAEDRELLETAAVVVGDVYGDSRYVPSTKQDDHRSLICIPIVLADEAIGVLNVTAKDRDGFMMEDARRMQLVADRVSDALALDRTRTRSLQELLQNAVESVIEALSKNALAKGGQSNDVRDHDSTGQEATAEGSR